MRSNDRFDFDDNGDDDEEDNGFDLAAGFDEDRDPDLDDELDDDASIAERCEGARVDDAQGRASGLLTGLLAGLPTEFPTDPAVIEDLALLNVELLRRLVRDTLVRRQLGRCDPWKLTPFQLREVALELARTQSGRRQTLMERIARPWRMSHTELTLRLAVHLVRERIVTSTVRVSVAPAELVRRRHPWFDIPGFLERYQAVPGTVDPHNPVYSQYHVPGVDHDIQLERDRGQGSIVADVGPGSRLIVHACPGPVHNSRSSREHMVLRLGVGAALTKYEATDDDIVVLAVPRSPRMQQLVHDALERPAIRSSRLSLVLVDRADRVDGLPFPGRYEPPALELA
ncbi:MAG TPA: hypothetical protein VH277_15720 [Gemmatimonadaceae bacterium]|jgi:hypothetical protein|nr:hypothetical protein [Gemmatimonadaceae bacterium]